MPNFRKVVSLGGIWELPPPTLQRAASGTWFESVVRYVLRPLWGWRLELGAFGAALGMWGLGCSRLGELGAGILAAGLVGGCVAWPRSRSFVARAFGWPRLRRRWGKAVRFAGLATLNDRIPRPIKIEAVPAGEQLWVKIPSGSSVARLADEAESIAAILRVREVRVVRDSGDAGRARITVVRRD